MRLTKLYLHNIGPFQDSEMELLAEEQVEALKKDPSLPLPVVIITGENGTGKSVILDAIRTVLSGTTKLERDIIADHDDFKISLDYLEKSIEKNVVSESFAGYENLGVKTNDRHLNEIITDQEAAEKVDWIVDYWSPDLDTGSFKISNLSTINPQAQMDTPFLKTFENSKVNQFICNLDYLRGSDKEEERQEGQYLYDLLASMLSDCLADGRFLYVARRTMMPMVEVRGKELPLDKLSMGNLLLFNHFVSTLYRMYIVSQRLHIPIEQVNRLHGVLLIDEIENHLHPKWQRKIIGLIQKYFPNLQLIVTTHSPFVVTAVDNSKVFVCVSRTDHSMLHKNRKINMLFNHFMLHSNRIILDALGVEDFGTYNVVGGVAAMFATMQQIYNIRQMGESKGHFYELFFALNLPPSVFPNINLKCKKK